MSLERVVRAGRVELPLSPYKEASLPLTDARTLTRNYLERPAGIEPACSGLEDRSLNPLGHGRVELGTPGVIRTPNHGFGDRQPHHRQPERGARRWS
jgi:hypothetical protein